MSDLQAAPVPGFGTSVSSGSRTGARWHCAWTHFREERRAVLELRRRDFETYLPLRLDRQTRCAEVLFRGYVFLCFDPHQDPWGAIRSTPGVGGLICQAAGHPTPLPPGIVEHLVSRTSRRGVVDDPGDAPRALAVGTAVGLVTGPMAGLRGICQWSDEARVRLLLSLLGREVSVTVSRAAVEVA
jgi:transcription antitermination factor NusG